MSKKRTIDSYFGVPHAKKPREYDPVDEPTTSKHVDRHISLDASDANLTTVHRPITYSIHTSYPFPIPHLPDALATEISGPPALSGRAISDQPDLDLLYYEPFISRPAARELFEFLRSELPFYRVEYDIARGGNKTHIRTPRWTTVFGVDATASFRSGSLSDGSVVDLRTGKRVEYRANPRPIPRCLDVLRKSTEAATGCRFNFCLVNYYASGADSISFHSDDERFLGPVPAIASFSLGARRDFLMKHKPLKLEPKDTSSSNGVAKGSLKLPLGSGDMVLMRGTTQANWLHSIPKRSGKNEHDGGRINITFRQALVRGGTENYYQYNVGNGPVYKWDAAGRIMKPLIQSSNAANTGMTPFMPSNASPFVVENPNLTCPTLTCTYQPNIV